MILVMQMSLTLTSQLSRGALSHLSGIRFSRDSSCEPTAIPAVAPVLRDEDGLLEEDGGDGGFLVLVSVERLAVLVPDTAVRSMSTAKSGASNPLAGVVLVAPLVLLPPIAVRISISTTYVVRLG
ncbi:hypothetical protein FOXG_14894 [Fusarium oxysporum f. sp. lycopersici 4287]|uniref:Uncharacterized protein n=2 Tax=Fusarium oxysporum TaxID=5507 RepID=A0A0J9W1Z1_FUSO4|nr:hypothetical protein FOXG_14894 [Fusarium oxysporum f. sp. lycopersici 4287]KNB16865.1 hypothetical protein FOXG_14894 [Fusarium oxysporum f. sp. lycopersici 4287]